LNTKNNKSLSNPKRVTAIGNRMTKQQKIFDFSKKTALMGVLNCTTDSMSLESS
jgi:hypothetical protein